MSDNTRAHKHRHHSHRAHHQGFALFPCLTVIENVEAPLEARGIPGIERHKRALRIIDSVGLDGFESADPKERSGGMKPRVGVPMAIPTDLKEAFAS